MDRYYSITVGSDAGSYGSMYVLASSFDDACLQARGWLVQRERDGHADERIYSVMESTRLNPKPQV